MYYSLILWRFKLIRHFWRYAGDRNKKSPAFGGARITVMRRRRIDVFACTLLILFGRKCNGYRSAKMGFDNVSLPHRLPESGRLRAGIPRPPFWKNTGLLVMVRILSLFSIPLLVCAGRPVGGFNPATH